MVNNSFRNIEPNLAPLGEVDKLRRLVEEVRVAFLQEENVRLVLTEERNTGGVD